jgi:hypothetical protein
MLAAAMAAPWDSWPVVPLAHPADAMACEIAGRTLDVQCNKDEGCLFDLALTMTGPCTDGLTLAPGATQPRAETPDGFVRRLVFYGPSRDRNDSPVALEPHVPHRQERPGARRPSKGIRCGRRSCATALDAPARLGRHV